MYFGSRMKIHKVAIIRNRPSEKLAGLVAYTRCGIEIDKRITRKEWRKVTCKNCLRTRVESGQKAR